MKEIVLCCLLLLAGAMLLETSAQKKLLILGSSTSSCYNISYDSCYVGRLQRYFQQAGQPVVIDDRAVAGDNCYHGMPTSYTPPAGRNGARSYNNITDGLQGNPDIVLVNYPSNGYDDFSVDEVMFCLRTIKQTANNAGKPCYITTSQPRSQPASFQTPAVRQKMQQIRDNVLNEFGAYAINFWDRIVNPADNSLQPIYNSGDGTHLTAAGHQVLFEQVVAKNLFATAQTGNLSYRYYEGNWNQLPDFNALTPVKTGSSPNISLAPRNQDDYFGFVWEGTINIPAAGTYTFETNSDDGSKFYFNSLYANNATALVNNDGAHGAISASGSVYVPAAGAYPVAITFFEKNGGEQMQLFWSGPGISRQPVPDAAFGKAPATPAGGGLTYQYFEGSWNNLPDFSGITPLKSGTASNLDLSVRSRDTYYAIQWTGSITIPTDGNYTFETISDDGSMVYIGNNLPLVVNNDGQHGVLSRAGSTYLAAGTYPVKIAFMNACCDGTMQLYWTGPGISRQLVPNSAFLKTGTPPVSSTGLNYKYYEGDFSALPNFNALAPVKTGTSANLDITVRNAGVNDRFAFMWTGSINLPSAGTYTFETISDDGSKVYFNTPYSAGASALVNNDGAHGPASVSGTVTVPSAGQYPITITYFEKDGGETMQLYWTGPGISRQIIPNSAYSTASAVSSQAFSSLSKLTTADVPAGGGIHLYPNPFSQSFTIDYVNGNGQSKAVLDIYDLNGLLVYTYQPASLNAGLNRWTVKIADKKLGAGMYMAQLKIGGVPVKTMKLVKMR